MLISSILIKGLPIIAYSDGKKIDEVLDIVYDFAEQKVLALIVSRRLFWDLSAIALSDIKIIGKDAVIVNDNKVIRNLADIVDSKTTQNQSGAFLRDTPVITENGQELGKISDIFFEGETGNVTEVEVGHGGFKDFTLRRRRIKTRDIIKIGQDAIIVNTAENATFSAAEEKLVESFEKVAKTIANTVKQVVHHSAFQDTNTRVTIKTIPIQEDTSEYVSFSSAGGRSALVQSKTASRDTIGQQKVHEKVGDEIDVTKKSDVVGAYLTKNVLSSDDKVLAKQGDMITYKLLATAEKHGVLEQIYNYYSLRREIL